MRSSTLAAPLNVVALLPPRATGWAVSTLPLTTIATVPLPGAATRFDYESLDSATGRQKCAIVAVD